MHSKATVNYHLVSGGDSCKADRKERVQFLGGKPKMQNGLYHKVRGYFKRSSCWMKKSVICKKENETCLLGVMAAKSLITSG